MPVSGASSGPLRKAKGDGGTRLGCVAGGAGCSGAGTPFKARFQKGCVMTQEVVNVLFLCTGNSARSILAEAILNQLGAGSFRAYSAGSEPKGRVHPLTLEVLGANGYPTEGLRSKDLAEMESPEAPPIKLLFTVCDRAAESCPIWLGAPIKAHWGVPDPVEVEGDEATRRAAFVGALRTLEARIRRFLRLPFDTLSTEDLRRRLQEIGLEGPDSAAEGPASSG
jgi:arsenate reductase (thioredoxin)